MRKVNIIGHRGSAGTLPENSLAGFVYAAKLGVDGIELDVHQTRDGEVVVIHDDTIDRTTNGIGSVKNLTLPELQEFRLLDGKTGLATEERIPTLVEVLQQLAEYPHVVLHIELKMHRVFYEGLEEKVLEIVEQYGTGRQVVYSSFHLPSLVRLKKMNPSAKIALLMNKQIPQLHDYVRLFQLEGIHLDKKLFNSHSQIFEDCCGSIRVWTVNKESEMKKLFRSSIDAMITDFPEQALRLRKKQSRLKLLFRKKS